MPNNCSPEILNILFTKGAQVTNSTLLLRGERGPVNEISIALLNNCSSKILNILFANGADPRSLPKSHPRRQEMIDYCLEVPRKLERDENDKISKTIAEFSNSSSTPKKLSTELVEKIAGYIPSNTFNPDASVRSGKIAAGYHKSREEIIEQKNASTTNNSAPTKAAKLTGEKNSHYK